MKLIQKLVIAVLVWVSAFAMFGNAGQSNVFADQAIADKMRNICVQLAANPKEDAKYIFNNAPYPYCGNPQYFVYKPATLAEAKNVFDVTGKYEDLITIVDTTFANYNDTTYSNLCGKISAVPTTSYYKPGVAAQILAACKTVNPSAATPATGSNSNTSTPGDCGFLGISCAISNVITPFVVNFGKGVAGFIAAILAILAYFLAALTGLVVNIMAYFANELLLINPASNQYIGVARSVFGVFSNLVNLVILFLFIKTGFEFIFNDKKSPDLSNFIITVATVAIGVQFSFAIAAAVIALSFNIGYIFLITVAPGEVNPFIVFFDVISKSLNLDFSNFFSGIGTQLGAILTGGADIGSGQLIGTAALQIAVLVMYLIAAWLMWLFIQKFAIRAVSLFFLLITAPIGFVFFVAGDLDKDVKKFGEDWWSGLINNSVAYPIVVIGLAIGARLVSQVSAINTGGPVSLAGLDAFNPATYSIIIAPLIQKILPAIIAIGTLFLIYDWVEKNLQTALGGVTNKLMQFAGKGANLVTGAYRNLGRGTTQTAGFLRGGGLKAIGSSIATPFNGLGTGLKALVGQPRGTSVADRLKNANIARRDTIIGAKKVKQKLYESAVSNAVAAGQGFNDTMLTTGSRNFFNKLLPRRLEFDKNGNAKLVANENASTLQHQANVSAGLAQAAVDTDAALRKGAATQADILYADGLANKAGIDTELQGRGAEYAYGEIAKRSQRRARKGEKLRDNTGNYIIDPRTGKPERAKGGEAVYDASGRPVMSSNQFSDGVVRSRQRNAVQAVNKKLGVGKDNNFPDVSVMMETIERDLLSNGLSGLSEAFLKGNPVAVKYLEKMLFSKGEYTEDIRGNKVLNELMTTGEGWKILKSQFRNDGVKNILRNNLNAGTGYLPSEAELDKIKIEDSQFLPEVGKIESERRKMAEKPETMGGQAYADPTTIGAVIEESTKNGRNAQNAMSTGRGGFVAAQRAVNTAVQDGQASREADLRQAESVVGAIPKAILEAAGGSEKYLDTVHKAIRASAEGFGKLASSGVMLNTENLVKLERVIKEKGMEAIFKDNKLTAEATDILFPTGGVIKDSSGDYQYDHFEAALGKGANVAKNFDTKREDLIRSAAQQMLSDPSNWESKLVEFSGGDADLAAHIKTGLSAIIGQDDRALAGKIASGTLSVEEVAKVSKSLNTMNDGVLTTRIDNARIGTIEKKDASGAVVKSYAGKTLKDVMRVVSARGKEVESIVLTQAAAYSGDTSLTSKALDAQQQVHERVYGAGSFDRAAAETAIVETGKLINSDTGGFLNLRYNEQGGIQQEQLQALKEIAARTTPASSPTPPTPPTP